MKGAPMPDVLIRDVSPTVVRWLDEQADHFRLSRNEFLKRQLAGWAGQQETAAVTDDDWAAFDSAFPDLGDAQVVAQAWR